MAKSFQGSRHIHTNPFKGGADFYFRPQGVSRMQIDHFFPFLPSFASFFKYFNAKIAPKPKGEGGPSYLRPCKGADIRI